MKPEILSAYRLVWLLVMFDLPVMTKPERKAAQTFRLDLLDMGFSRSQFSVYMRFCTSYKNAATYTQRVQRALPGGGNVTLMSFTDKQYERTLNFNGQKRLPKKSAPDQFDLF